MRRILSIGLGPLGRMIAHDLHERDAGRIVAAVDLDPKIAGGALVDVVDDRGWPRVVRHIEELPSEVWGEIDAAIVTTTSDLPSVAAIARPVLERGVAVVSTCEELVWPWLRHPALADELDTLAHRHGGRLLGTGVNPGFVMDALPVFASGVMRSVSRVECHRVQDASTRRVPFQRKIGVGLAPDEFDKRIRDGSLRHVGLGESLHFIANYVGLPVERWSESIDAIYAERALDSEHFGRIQPGMARGVRQIAEGFDPRGELVVRLVFEAALGQRDPYDRVRIDGDPPIDLTIRGGMHGDIATTAIVINSIDRLREAPPGLHTMATIPLVRRV